MKQTKPAQCIALALALIALYGCSNRLINPLTHTNEQQTKRTEKVFVGIPSIFSFEGSAVRLDETWMLTARHNYPTLILKDEVHYHPRCDVALYKDPINEPLDDIKIGTVYTGEKIQATGYPKHYPLTTTYGTFDVNVKLTSKRFQNCTYSGGDFGVMSGMSGGGIWHEKTGHLVGITHGWALLPVEDHGFIGLFVAIRDLDPWLKEITGKSFLTEKHTP
ncbi:hypothetical protein [Vibrio owensii]|uniref:hypothetical protein n=1 Tax=Vibrio owensii TaxID=696485 RepID=UPI0018F1215A|nr:hypothetical protein [Vibrio owensii]